MANQYSSLKIFHHKDILDAMENNQRFAPLYIRMKPTNLCNHHCQYCSYGSGIVENQTAVRDSVHRTDMIPWPKMQEILADIGSMGVKALTFSGGGEPLTYPHILEAVRLVKEQGIDLALISNGQLLTGDIASEFYHAKWVRISFDSPNEAEYMALRNVSAHAFRTVIRNIREFAAKKDKNCVLGINFVVSKANYNRSYEAAELLKNLGVDNVKFSALIDNKPNYHKDIKDKVISLLKKAQLELASEGFKIINSYEKEWQDVNFVKQPFPKCYACRFLTVIAADQKVYTCFPKAYDSKAVLGDLTNKRFKDMWFSDETTKKLDSLVPSRDCQNLCVYSERNQLIQAYYDVDRRHINFI